MKQQEEEEEEEFDVSAMQIDACSLYSFLIGGLLSSYYTAWGFLGPYFTESGLDLNH